MNILEVPPGSLYRESLNEIKTIKVCLKYSVLKQYLNKYYSFKVKEMYFP